MRTATVPKRSSSLLGVSGFIEQMSKQISSSAKAATPQAPRTPGQPAPGKVASFASLAAASTSYYKAPSAPLPAGVAPSSSGAGTVGDAQPSEAATEQQKVPKPSATEVANKLFNLLLVSEPLSIPDICKQMVEIPRESVQSVLEILQVLGLVMQSMSTKESTSSRSSSSSNAVYLFSMTDYAKFSSAFPIANLEAEVKLRMAGTKEVNARNDELQALSVLLEDESLAPEQRTAMLKDAIDKLLTRHPQLWEDPLYQVLIEQLGCSAQPIAPQP